MMLKKIRASKGLTQSYVASKIGVKLRHYQYVEAGMSFLSKDKLNKLEDLFELPQRVLLAKSIEEVPDFYKPYLEKIEKHKD